MGKLSRDQRVALSQFFGSFAVAWLAAGVIAPYFSFKEIGDVYQTILGALLWAGLSIFAMLYLTKEKKK